MRVLLVQNELATARNVMQALKANGGIVDHIETGKKRSSWCATTTTISSCST